MRAYPDWTSGTTRPERQLMEAVPGLLLKGGAEGVDGFALADGRAGAFKIEDGARGAGCRHRRAAAGARCRSDRARTRRSWPSSRARRCWAAAGWSARSGPPCRQAGFADLGPDPGAIAVPTSCVPGRRGPSRVREGCRTSTVAQQPASGRQSLCLQVSYVLESWRRWCLGQLHLPGRLWTTPLDESATTSGSSELRMSAAASVKGLRMSERISKELRRGGKAAIIRRPD